MTSLNTIKKSLAKEYDIKYLSKVKIIIVWQMTGNIAICTMKIN